MTTQRWALVLLLSASVPMLGVAHAQETDTMGSPYNQAPTSPTPNQTVVNHPVKYQQGSIVRPPSSIPPAVQGTTPKTRIAHTDLEIMLPAGWKPSEVSPPRPDVVEPPAVGLYYETPASLACLYSLVTVTTGCNPQTVSTNPSGGSKTIAIVDAYDDPFAGPDLAYFSAQMGIPFTPSKFQVVYESGFPPPIDPTGGWGLEEALDTEYAHAMAPSATIYLVEADANDAYDLFNSVVIASNLVRCGKTTTCPTTATGTGEVSLSWGFQEFSTETTYDTDFTTPGVVYVAAAGDDPGTSYPCTSPNVVCAGGTTVRRNPATGAYMSEWSWPLSGGGVSQYEKIPSYQSSISTIIGGKNRGVPDISMDSDPVTGLWVWSSIEFYLNEELPNDTGWWIVGGTSAATPTFAGIINRAGAFRASSSAELTALYADPATDFNDTTTGDCGPYEGWSPTTGWDVCTGFGSPKAYAGK